MLRIDHVTLCASELEPLRGAFAAVGLATEYGGAHANGVTHMALLGFDDGSYIELIAPMRPQTESPLWDRAIRARAGPCAWAVRSDDIMADVQQLRARGIPVRGPEPLGRRRPDGVLAEWELAFPGEQEPGALLPFLIQDRTPRANRVRPSASVAGSGLKGVVSVVLGVWEMGSAIRLFRQAYGWASPEKADDSVFGAQLARFPDTPVVLAAPLGPDGWLAERLQRVGEAPVAFVIQSAATEAILGRGPLSSAEPWFGGEVLWFNPDRLGGKRLGVIAAATSPASTSP